MQEDFPKDRIFNEVKAKNQERGINIDQENFKVLFTRPHAKNPNLFQAIVRVSNEVRAAIDRAGDKIFVDLTLCGVFNHFHIRRCNKCQGFNHFKDTCNKPPRCCNCAGEHETEQCTTPEQVKCINCVDNEHDHTDHKASDPGCKSYKHAQSKLEQTIGFFKKN